jgi:hypothetical protein
LPKQLGQVGLIGESTLTGYFSERFLRRQHELLSKLDPAPPNMGGRRFAYRASERVREASLTEARCRRKILHLNGARQIGIEDRLDAAEPPGCEWQWAHARIA